MNGVGFWHFSDPAGQADDVGSIEVNRTSQPLTPRSEIITLMRLGWPCLRRSTNNVLMERAVLPDRIELFQCNASPLKDQAFFGPPTFAVYQYEDQL